MDLYRQIFVKTYVKLILMNYSWFIKMVVWLKYDTSFYVHFNWKRNNCSINFGKAETLERPNINISVQMFDKNDFN